MRTEADELPEGWAWAKLGELASPSSEKVEPKDKPDARYLSLEHVEAHTGQILGFGRGSDVHSTKAVFRAGDVLYGKLRPYLNKVSVPDFGGICSTDILVFPQKPWIDSRFLMRFLSTSSVVEFANHNSSGVQLPRIGFGELSTIDVPLPPRAEQKRIVAKVEHVLERVTVARERLASVPALLNRFRQAVLAAACSGRLTQDWRHGKEDLESATRLVARVSELRQQRYAEACRVAALAGRSRPRQYDNGQPALRDDIDLFEVPESWRWVDLRFVMDEQRPFCYGVVQPGEDDPAGVFLVRAGDLQNGTVNVADLRKIPVEVDAQYPRSKLEGGELLITVVGAGIGAVSIAPGRCAGFNLARALAKVPIKDFVTNSTVGLIPVDLLSRAASG